MFWFVCLNEHWLTTNSVYLLDSIPGYTLAAFCCRNSLSHGGSCTIIKNYSNFLERQGLSIYNEDGIF